MGFRTGQRSDRMMGLLWQTVDSYAEGDPHALLLGELRSLLSEHDHAAVSFVVSAIEVMLAIRAGRPRGRGVTRENVCATSGAAAG